jgi:hypothetical protein
MLTHSRGWAICLIVCEEPESLRTDLNKSNLSPTTEFIAAIAFIPFHVSCFPASSSYTFKNVPLLHQTSDTEADYHA